jgi:hypothetical protein
VSDVLERIDKRDKSTYSLSGGPLTLSRDDLNDLLHLAKLGKQMQWVSVNTPPKIEDVYLVRYSSGHKTTQAYSGVGSFCGGITHWMLLPPNPKEAK